MKITLTISVLIALVFIIACSADPRASDDRAHAGEGSTVQAALTDRELRDFVTVPPDVLPNDVRLARKLHTAPIGPGEQNPDVLRDSRQVQLLGRMMGFGDAAFLEQAKAGVVAVYEQHSQAPPNEIGVWGLYFSDQSELASATKAMSRLRGIYKSRAFMRKGPLLLTIWSDVKEDRTALRAMASYFKSK